MYLSLKFIFCYGLCCLRAYYDFWDELTELVFKDQCLDVPASLQLHQTCWIILQTFLSLTILPNTPVLRSNVYWYLVVGNTSKILIPILRMSDTLVLSTLRIRNFDTWWLHDASLFAKPLLHSKFTKLTQCLIVHYWLATKQNTLYWYQYSSIVW